MPVVVEIQVAEGSSEVVCPNCGAVIQVINDTRKKNQNEIYCYGTEGSPCGAALILTDDNGDDLNLWWASFKTQVDYWIGELFDVNRFPSRPIASQWARFQKGNKPEVILAAAKRLAKRLKESKTNIGDSAWRQVMASVDMTHNRLKEPTPNAKAIIFEIPDAPIDH